MVQIVRRNLTRRSYRLDSDGCVFLGHRRYFNGTPV